MRIAAHQPNFLPGLAFFAKLAQVDRFILLDDVQLSRPSYTTRVEIMEGERRRWLSLPVDPNPTWVLIQHARLDVERHPGYVGAQLGHIVSAYGELAAARGHLADLLDVTSLIGRRQHELLAARNEYHIHKIAERLGLKARRPRASYYRRDTPPARGDAVAGLLRPTGATVYVAGAGEVARGVIDAPKYEAAGVTVEPTRWRHPADSGVPEGLSIIDTIARLGLAGTRALIDRGIA